MAPPSFSFPVLSPALAWLRSVSIYKLAIYLLLLCALAGLIALPDSARPPALLTLAVAVLAAVLAQILLSYKPGVPILLSEPALISGLIIGSALAPQTPAVWVALISVLAMAGKRLLRVRHVPLFNAAALGLLAGSLLFGTHTAWWASNSTPLLTLLLALSLLVLSWKLKRLFLQLAFIALWLLLWGALALLAGNAPPLSFFLNSLPLYLLAFMLLEHTTSPMRPSWQVLYGALAAGAAFALTLTSLPVDALLVGLLAANALAKLLLFLPAGGAPAGGRPFLPPSAPARELCLGKADLRDGGTRCLSAGGKNFSLVRLGGKYYCVDNACTHMGGPLCKGRTGELNGYTITCPWHQSVFDLRDGQVLRGPAQESLRRYDVSVRNGKLYVRA
ncbi:3-phenylpropionate/cinnamic acid dioxygenase ferredoxin subunit [uncultured archaeon]|nr:3-phenylpropionate/cinnamic acid dioxygenase ferredoxin subunit [uncultured archaeon]